MGRSLKRIRGLFAGSALCRQKSKEQSCSCKALQKTLPTDGVMYDGQKPSLLLCQLACLQLFSHMNASFFLRYRTYVLFLCLASYHKQPPLATTRCCGRIRQEVLSNFAVLALIGQARCRRRKPQYFVGHAHLFLCVAFLAGRAGMKHNILCHSSIYLTK